MHRGTGQMREMGAQQVEGVRAAVPSKVSTLFERDICETYRNLPGRRPPKRRAHAIQSRTPRHKPPVIEHECAGASAEWALLHEVSASARNDSPHARTEPSMLSRPCAAAFEHRW